MPPLPACTGRKRQRRPQPRRPTPTGFPWGVLGLLGLIGLFGVSEGRRADFHAAGMLPYRSARMSDRDKRPRTRLVEGGRRKEWRGRLVNPPVERASTILFDSVADSGSEPPGPRQISLRASGHGDAMGAGRSADRRSSPAPREPRFIRRAWRRSRLPLLALLRPAKSCSCPTTSTGRRASFATRSSSASVFATRYYDPLSASGVAELIGPEPERSCSKARGR